MPKCKKRERQNQETGVRDRLMEAAVSIFARKGYAATSVKEIVEKVGVTKPVLYYYFKNKEGLFIEIMESAKSAFREVLHSAENGEPLPALMVVCDQILDLLQENADYHRIIHMVYFGPPQGAPPVDFESFHHALHDTLHSLVQKGMKDGSLRKGNPQDVVRVLLGVISFCLDVQLYHPEWAPGKEGQRRMLEVVFRGITAAAGLKSVYPRKAITGPCGSRPHIANNNR